MTNFNVGIINGIIIIIIIIIIISEMRATVLFEELSFSYA